MRLSSYLYLVVLFASGVVSADTIRLFPDRDATLIEHPHGELANGSGPALFVGRTGQHLNGVRRALLHFDIAGTIPREAIIENVSLRLQLTPSNPEPSTISVHRVLDDWREGPSSSAGGSGVSAQNGDATWLHTNYDVAHWKRVGGHFVASASSTLVVGSSNHYTWRSTPQLLADVRLWLKNHDKNFGWILNGDEDRAQTVKRFDSRETENSALRPVLLIEYRLAHEP